MTYDATPGLELALVCPPEDVYPDHESLDRWAEGKFARMAGERGVEILPGTFRRVEPGPDAVGRTFAWAVDTRHADDTPTRSELRIKLPNGLSLWLHFDVGHNGVTQDALEAMLDTLHRAGYDAALDIYRETLVRSGDTPN